jgi:hypothetical protein
MAAAVAGASALAGVAALRPGASIALWVLFGSAVVAHWAGRRASDCGVLADIGARPVEAIAVPLAVVAARSPTPLLDLARMRAAGGGAIVSDGVTRVVTDRRVECADLDLVLAGRWDVLAIPATQIAPGVAADHLRRLPDEEEVWLVPTRSGARMLSGDGLRSAAAIARTVRGGAAGTAAGTAERAPQTPDRPVDVDVERPPDRLVPQRR